MYSYKHFSGATIHVDKLGKKTIYKYGKTFQSFNELKSYEANNEKFIASHTQKLRELRSIYINQKNK